MNENDIRDFVYDAIQDGCMNENHEELKYAIHLRLIGPNPLTNQTELRLYIDDVRGWESVFFNAQINADTSGFYFDIQDAVHLLIQDYLALPHDKNSGFRYSVAPETTDIRDHSEDAVDALRYACMNDLFIQNGRANGKTKILYNRGDNLGKYSKYFYNEKGNTDMATERYMSESEAWYDTELKKIETELNQKITEAQFEAQKKRCELESKFRALRIEEQEAEKASKRKAYYDGLIASGFTKDQAMEILLKELH